MPPVSSLAFTRESNGEYLSPNHYEQSGRLPLQRRAQCRSQNAVELSSHFLRPPHAKQNGGRRAQVSCPSSDRTFREKSSAALKRRLFPNSNLTIKQLAYALRISEPTIWNLLSGNNDPSGRVFFKLVEFFGASFLGEVFGGPSIHVLDPRAAKKAEHIKRIAELQAELEAMG